MIGTRFEQTPYGCREEHGVYGQEQFERLHKERKTSTGHGQNLGEQNIGNVSRCGGTQ